MNIIRKIKILDTFGVPIQVTFNTESQFRSQIGAFVSLIMYSLSLIYAIYIFEEWINWKILPKVQTQVNTIRYTAVSLEEGDVTFGYFNDTTIDPFSRKDNILTPILMKLNNTSMDVVGNYFSELRNVNYAEDKRPTVALPGLNLTLTKGQNFVAGINNEISYVLILSICKEQYLIETNASCASEDKIEKFLNNAKTLDFNVNLRQYNIQTQQFETIQKSMYFTLQNQSRLFSQIMLKTTNQTVDSGIIFNNYKIKTFIDDFNVISEYVTPDVQKRFGTENFLMQFFIKLDNIQTSENVAYNKLGEILAQIGSIVQLLLTVKYGIFIFNKQQLTQKMIEDISTFQYPEISNLEIERNFFGNIIKVSRNEQQYDVQDFENFMDQIKFKILEKMDLNQIVKEIISIQTFILNTFSVCTSVSGQNTKNYKEFTHSQVAKIFPQNDDAELKSNGCFSQQFTQTKLQVEQIN